MPRMTGLQAARGAGPPQARAPTLILSMYENEQFLFEALKAGASGYVLKSGADRDIVEACRRRDARRDVPLPVGGLDARARLRPARRRRGAFDPLTPREQRGPQADRRGPPVEGDRPMLTISVKTVERHRANILEKLGMRDRVELTRYAIRRGLIEP